MGKMRAHNQHTIYNEIRQNRLQHCEDIHEGAKRRHHSLFNMNININIIINI